VVGLRSRPAPPDFFGPRKEAVAIYNELDEVEQRGKARYNGLVDKAKSKNLDDDTMAAVVEDEILPPLAEVRKRLDALDPVIPGLRYPPVLVAKYVRDVEAAWRLVAEGLRAHDGDKVARGIKELEQAGRIFEGEP
jgi:hypothetical protein